MNEKVGQLIKDNALRQTDLRRLYGNIQDQLEDVEEKLRELARSSNPLIAEIGGYLFQKSGKRIRPALVLLCAGLFARRGGEEILSAALVEFIHTASLLHDDIIDNSATRRGMSSVHAKWGPNVTVLLGDYLYIKTLHLSLGSRLQRLTRILTDVSAQMIEGELQEYAQSGNLLLAEKDYLEIIERKTASLFSASCRIGGILGEASAEEEEALAAYGTSLGLCFQVIDDLLDYTGQEENLGKPVLSDLMEGRITLPLIDALRQNGRGDRDKILRLLPEVKTNPAAREKILDILRSGPSLEYAFSAAEKYCRKAKAFLEAVPGGPYRQSLSLLADYILQRNR
jgi:octaprenyl-diphosphate synthase